MLVTLLWAVRNTFFLQRPILNDIITYSFIKNISETMSQSRRDSNMESVTEDSVQCLFFFTSLLKSDITSWEQRCNSINNAIQKIADNYIWHKEKLKLYLPIGENKHFGMPPHLASSTYFGDNIEDEWFIVYIVLQLTKQYEDLIVQVMDSDGDFLLIEAANLLPSWANPENTFNRVFIANGSIHIIEPDVAKLGTKLDLHDCIKIVLCKQTYSSPDIDKKILCRIGNYPDKIEENLHRALVHLPLPIATLLIMEPTLIAPIVCAYCDHDIIDMKACKNIHFDNCVTVRITFTKFLYAMLANSKLLKCNNKFKLSQEKDRKAIIGFKLACGFQIIKNSTSDIFSTKEYHKFVSSLRDNGYFKNNIEGSKEYTALLEKAKGFFSNIECPMNLYVCNKISEIMESNDFANHMERIRMNSLTTEDLYEDSEDWLNIQPDQLNNFLNNNYGKKTRLKKDDLITPEVITSELSSFLTKSSDFEGIETYDEDDKYINFDTDEFSNCLEKMLNLFATKHVNSDLYSEDSDIDEMDEEDMQGLQNNFEEELDVELKNKLNRSPEQELCSDNSITRYIIQSMREEQASSGPSSNLLKAIGINKRVVLDSDDDD